MEHLSAVCPSVHLGTGNRYAYRSPDPECGSQRLHVERHLGGSQDEVARPRLPDGPGGTSTATWLNASRKVAASDWANTLGADPMTFMM